MGIEDMERGQKIEEGKDNKDTEGGLNKEMHGCQHRYGIGGGQKRRGRSRRRRRKNE